MKNKIYALIGPSGCVDCDTEFFNGIEWKKISMYKDGESVLQYNYNGEAELVIPQKYHKYKESEMYHIKNKNSSIDQVLSSNHNVLYRIRRDGDIYGESLRKKPLHELCNFGKMKCIEIPRVFTGFDKGIDLNDCEIRFIVWAITDGTYHYDRDSNSVSFNLKKKRKVERLSELLDDCGYKYSKKSHSDGYTRFYVSHNIGSKIKEFDKSWYFANKKQCKIIIEECIETDGIKNGKRRSFHTTSKKNADFIQFTATKIGIVTSIYIDDRVGEVQTSSNGNKYKRKSICYSVIFSSKNKSGFSSVEKASIKKVNTVDGFKYCFTVDSGMLVLRRNNRIFITGNSGKTTIGDFIKLKGVNEIVSHTTRQQRKGESDDTYYFVDREYMEAHKDNFIELVEYSGNLYGTSKKEVEEKLKLGHCYSILNRKGVELFQEYFGKENVVVIYFDIDIDEMETRMRERGDSEVDIQKRINNALETGEFDNFDIADYIVKQKELRKVKREVEGIVRSHRKPVLSVDIDDCVAEFLDPLLKEYNKRYDDNIKCEDITDWNLADKLKCGNDVWQIVLEKHFMEGLPVTKDAVEVLERLNNHFDIQFVTASRISSHERRNWVEKYFPFIGQKKTIFACDKNNIDTDILVDDGLHNLVSCSGEPICFARPHNHSYKGTRLNGWLEIEEYLMEEIVNEKD